MNRQTSPLDVFLSLAAMVGAALLLTRCALDSAEAQTVVPVANFPSQVAGIVPGIDSRYVAVATYVAKVNGPHRVCWTNPNYLPDDGNPKTKPVEDTAMQLAHRRYRIEGGAVETSVVLPFAQWAQAKTDGGKLISQSYCTTVAGPPAMGHWVYELRMCRDPWVSDEESCSEWVSSLSPYSGVVQDRPQGWWVYAFTEGGIEPPPPPPPPSACKVAPNSNPSVRAPGRRQPSNSRAAASVMQVAHTHSCSFAVSRCSARTNAATMPSGASRVWTTSASSSSRERPPRGRRSRSTARSG
jgi:hypothetical protein